MTPITPDLHKQNVFKTQLPTKWMAPYEYLVRMSASKPEIARVARVVEQDGDDGLFVVPQCQDAGARVVWTVRVVPVGADSRVGHRAPTRRDRGPDRREPGSATADVLDQPVDPVRIEVGPGMRVRRADQHGVRVDPDPGRDRGPDAAGGDDVQPQRVHRDPAHRRVTRRAGQPQQARGQTVVRAGGRHLRSGPITGQRHQRRRCHVDGGGRVPKSSVHRFIASVTGPLYRRPRPAVAPRRRSRRPARPARPPRPVRRRWRRCW